MRQQASQIMSQTVSFCMHPCKASYFWSLVVFPCSVQNSLPKKTKEHKHALKEKTLYIYICVCMFQSNVCLHQMEDGMKVGLARTVVVIRAGAEPVGSLSRRAPVQRIAAIARHPTNRQLETGEGYQPVGRAPVQCHHQPPRPSAADREPEEKVQQEEEADEIEIVTVDSSSSADEGVQEFFYKSLLERLREEDARDSEERKARRARQESGVLAEREEQEQKRRRQQGEPTRSRAAHYDSVTIEWP